MPRIYTYDININEPKDLEFRLVESLKLKRANQPISFGDILGEDENAIYTIVESYDGRFMGSSKSFRKNFNIRDFDRNLVEYLERNKAKVPNDNSLEKEVDEESTDDIHILIQDSMTSYSITKTYKLENGLVVTYALRDRSLNIRINFGYSDEDSKAFNEFTQEVLPKGRTIGETKIISEYSA